MDSFEFEDYSVKVKEEINDALISALYEVVGELQARAKRNSRQGHKYGDLQATALWDYVVDEDNMEAQIGSQYEAGYWEEFGTGEHALNKDGRKGWWVYVEGEDSGKGGKSYATKEEAEKAAMFLRRVKKLDAYATNGIEPNRPLHRAFQTGESIVQAILQSKLKGMG